KKLLSRGQRLTELLKQNQYAPLPIEEQVVSIYSGVKGYLDTVKVDDIARFEQGLLVAMRGHGAEILSSIRSDKAIKPETEEKLKKFMEHYLQEFA
ncbi:MAG: F0F1 ATP synthase subunit alpha, partial [Alphaproteobacteria bacterium]|nr:F0F1 ATP synthase subunit alpha [Alphaproteobacteria bacterium]